MQRYGFFGFDGKEMKVEGHRGDMRFVRFAIYFDRMVCYTDVLTPATFADGDGGCSW